MSRGPPGTPARRRRGRTPRTAARPETIAGRRAEAVRRGWRLLHQGERDLRDVLVRVMHGDLAASPLELTAAAGDRDHDNARVQLHAARDGDLAPLGERDAPGAIAHPIQVDGAGDVIPPHGLPALGEVVGEDEAVTGAESRLPLVHELEAEMLRG